MKKLNICPLLLVLGLFIFLFVSLCFANDTELGKIQLTPNQVANLSQLNGSLNGVVKGVSYWQDSGKLVVVPTRDLTDDEKSTLIKQAQALPDVAPIKPKTIEERLTELENKSK